jgi:tetratricopeptide (TPR) repeat protein
MVLAIVALALPAAAAPASPEVEIARKRFETGTVLYRLGRYQEALVEMQAAQKLVSRPELDFNIGHCLAKLGRAAEAADALERFVTARPDDPEAPALWREIAALRGQSLHRAPVAEPAVALLPPPTAAPLPPPRPLESQGDRPSWTRTARGRASLALAGVGAALLVGAAVTGGLAVADRSIYDSGCDRGSCDPDRFATAHTLALTTDVLIGAGAASALTAVIVGVTGARARRLALAPSLEPGAVGLAATGAF